MLEAMGHPFGRGEEVYDVTFENVQAGLRTDYLFRIANQRGGIVLGTGDLSELALGWCTYGVGDQMSHYGVNAGVPKTLMQHLIRWVVTSAQFEDHVGETLTSILDTEITPELVPAKEGEKPQSTQAMIGPVRPAGLHALPRAAPRLPALQDRLPRVARVARQRGGGVAGGLPRGGADGIRPRDDPALARGLRAGATSPTSSSAPRCPTGPRSSRAARCRRAATGVCRPMQRGAAWLDELDANVPED